MPDQQRQLVQCLCDAEGAMTVKQVAEENFIAEGNCSKQLGNLKSKGYVRSEERGKESYYDMAEPLMRLCLEVKNHRGRPLKLVARFLKAWFSVETLQQLDGNAAAKSRVDEYCEAGFMADKSFEQVKPLLAELERAFIEGDPESSFYGGTPKDLLMMVLQRGPSEWASYVSGIASLYVKYKATEKLGQGVTQSIAHLDQGQFSDSQLDTWNQCWQEAGKDCEDLQIPLSCLSAAIEVIKSDPKSDRPLFQLPLEIRQLIRPLLNESLGPRED